MDCYLLFCSKIYRTGMIDLKTNKIQKYTEIIINNECKIRYIAEANKSIPYNIRM